MTVPVPKPVRYGGWAPIWIVLAVPALILVLAAVGFPAVNDAAARGIESSLRDVPLPAGAEFVDSMALAGKLSGNGNGMQYLGALLIRSDQPMSEIRAYYDAVGNTRELSVDVTGPQGVNGLHRTPGFLGEPGSPGTVIVFAWGDGPGWFFEEFDLRGH